MSHADPFGASRQERIVRRLCGASASAATVVLGALLIWLPAAVLVVAASVYVVGLPASLLVEALWPANSSQRSLIGRYVGLGTLLGAVVGTVLSAPDFTWLLLNVIPALAGGALGGGVAAWAALTMPGRWVLPTAAAGPLAVAAVAGWMLWLGPPLL